VSGSEQSAGADVTALLHRSSGGRDEVRELLAERIYPELRRLAVHVLGGRPGEGSLQVTELVHEAYLRLVDQRRADWRDRGHFFAVAASLMRRALVDHLRRRGSRKRGGELRRTTLGEVGAAAEGVPEVDLLDLDRALERLAAIDPAAVRVVEVRFFAGMGVDETAEALGMGRTTVVRKWRFARAWLREELDGG